MGWAIVVLLAGASLAALWGLGRMPRAALGLSGVALLAGVAGYAWQGSPNAPDHPVAPPADLSQSDDDFAKALQSHDGKLDSPGAWLDFADVLQKRGDRRLAVVAIQTGLKHYPASADLWVGLGSALAAHADGLITPAARLSFERAAALAPDHPGPPFFLGLAYAQSGQTDKAAETWRALLARAPPDAPWRADLEMRLAVMEDQMGAGAAH